MSNITSRIIKSSVTNPIFLKKCWNVGQQKVTIIDKEIVRLLKIDENDTLFEQMITEEGNILLKIIKVKEVY